MNPDENPALLDGEDFPVGTDAETEAEPVAQAADVDLDEDLIDVDLGELDAPLIDDEMDDLDEELLDFDDDEDDEDDLEITLLQELGIDLDAPDANGLDFDLTVTLDDDAGEDEVAA